ncbi:MAG TPA: TonB family protein [Thermoanaerobaculia bacterium]|jgi:TonB family protein|nr:TonB family protein [Thermoanaerobaculia bacterium]
MRARRFFPLFFLVLSIALAPLRAQLVPLEVLTLPVEEWTIRLRHADELLRTGRWSRGRGEAEGLIKQMRRVQAQGEGFAELVGQAVAMRAIGAAGLKEMPAAAWDTAAAQAIGFDWKTLRLSAYGEAGARIRTELDSLATVDTRIRYVEADGEIVRPDIRNRKDFVYPAALRVQRINGQVIVESVIDERGVVRRPKILNPGKAHPLLVLAVLDSLRDWRFEPAQLNGKAMAVYYVLTTNLRVEE